MNTNNIVNHNEIDVGLKRLLALYQKRVKILRDELKRHSGDNLVKEGLRVKIETLEMTIVDIQKILVVKSEL